MPLDMKVDVRPGHIVLDEETQLPLPRKGSTGVPAIFSPRLLWLSG